MFVENKYQHSAAFVFLNSISIIQSTALFSIACFVRIKFSQIDWYAFLYLKCEIWINTMNISKHKSLREFVFSTAMTTS